MARHLRAEKCLHWHIDYLLGSKCARVEQVWAVESVERLECKWARQAMRWPGARIVVRRGRRFIVGPALEIPLAGIDLVPVGKASGLVRPWSGPWFRDDYCQGPGHVFFVLPDGAVKPCCGYATDSERLTLGNIRRDSAAAILKNARRNMFVVAVFEAGLGRLRRALAARGVVFPGKTAGHCFFCHWILNEIPPRILDSALRDLSLP